MDEYKIQFTVEDVVKKLEELKELPEEQRKYLRPKLEHDLCSCLAHAHGMYGDFHEVEGENTTLHQRAYASNASALNRLVMGGLVGAGLGVGWDRLAEQREWYGSGSTWRERRY